jgi:hypothetical protein
MKIPNPFKLTTLACVALSAGSALLAASVALADDDDQQRSDNHVSVMRTLNKSTQGPPWPPGTVTDQNGNFIVVGNILTEVKPGVIQQVHGAALVSKDTVPPLDAHGRENFSNPLAAPYKVLHTLDLTPGSADMQTVLYSPSYGPPRGNFGGGPRIPMAGESRYNLNMITAVCPETFPAASQLDSYVRKSFPLHEYPIPGFQGDQIAYNVDTGAPYDPHTKTGASCGPGGCSGENVISQRTVGPITLGRWLAASGEMSIKLTQFDPAVGAFTAARFSFKLKHLLPHSLYTLWAIRQNVFTFGSFPGPFALPATVITDAEGNAELTSDLPNPFPDRTLDDAGLRVVGVEIVYHPDYQNWGACPERLGVGYHVLTWYDFLPDGTRDLSQFVTRAHS